MRLRITENKYAPGLVQQRHAHAESTITLVLAGGLEESVGSRHEHARPLSIVIKPADTEHANRVGHAGAHTLQLILPPGVIPDEKHVLGLWRWEHAGPNAQQFVRVLSAFRAEDGSLEHEVLDLLATLRPPAVRPERDAPIWLKQVRQHIDDLLPDLPRVQQLASDAAVHPVYLARQFRRFFGCTVTDYISRRRAQLAATYLADPALRLSTVAYRAGYADQSHFCRAFRAASGVTPRAYRGLAHGSTQTSSQRAVKAYQPRAWML